MADHPMQSREWGEFRKRTGVVVVREGGIQITIHKIPYTKWNVGYAPKITRLDKDVVATLAKIAKEYSCIFIKIEPKIEAGEMNVAKLGLVAGRPLFTKYNFVLDVNKTEEELLSQMKQKTRYNIRIAIKKGVTVEIDNSPAAFAKYLELTKETTTRQGFFAHSPSYHKKMWETLNNSPISPHPNVMRVQANSPILKLSAHLLVAKLKKEIITAWVLFKFKDTLYYPYGASTREHREVMANNLVMWEAIRQAKKWKCKYLDMWGALGPEPDPNDPWYGFHNFKAGYGARAVEYIGTWDYVARPLIYRFYVIGEKLRWWWLRARKSS